MHAHSATNAIDKSLVEKRLSLRAAALPCLEPDPSLDARGVQFIDYLTGSVTEWPYPTQLHEDFKPAQSLAIRGEKNWRYQKARDTAGKLADTPIRRASASGSLK